MPASAASFEIRKRQVLDFLAKLAPQDEPLLQSIESLILAELETPNDNEISTEHESLITVRRKKFLADPESGIPWEAVYQKLKSQA